MTFYKIATRMNKVENPKDGEYRAKVCENLEILNDDYKRECFATISNMTGFKCEVVVIWNCEREYLPEKIVEDINKCCNLTCSVKSCEEITQREAILLLKTADRHCYINSQYDVCRMYKLDTDNLRQEEIVKLLDKSEIENKAKKLLFDVSFCPEIERIFEKHNNSDVIIHPVHYVVKSDDKEESDEIIRCLVSALYENKRLKSKRISKIDITQRYYETNDLYKISKDGVVVIDIGEADLDEKHGSSVLGDIESKAKIVNANLKDVLTIVRLPINSEKVLNEVYNCMNASFIEIFPENASGERARSYLAYKAECEKAEIDESLFDNIEEGQSLCVGELREKFQKWYSKYVRCKIYPQYAFIADREKTNDSYAGKALQDLKEMIGLENAKKVIYNALDFYKVQNMYRLFGKNVNNPSMHMVFTGNPGTAKTTVARLFTQIMKDNDVITDGNLVEVGRADLVGKYVGHTAPMVKAAFQRAQGGVLFIDEAYSLLDDNSGSYGDEAINTIVQEMENNRDNTIVIFAGYPNEMEKFLNRNPGLRSRIAFHVPFDNYSTKDLCSIAELMAKNKENRIEQSAKEKLEVIFDSVVNEPDYGNGRFVRNVIEKAEMKRASRLAKMPLDSITKDMLGTFVAEDFEQDKKQAVKEKKLGFAV